MNNLAGQRPRRPTVSILGCGWFGLPFASELVRAGYPVMGSTTSYKKYQILEEAGIRPFVLNFPNVPGAGEDMDFFRADVLFIAIPPKRKEGKASEYVEKIKSICRYASSGGVKHLVLISSTGVFPNAGRAFIEFDSPEPESVASQALLDAEQEVRAWESFSSTIIRFGGLIGEGRDPGRFFAGKKEIENGLAPVNLIHLTDCIGICKAVLDQEAFGHIFHACSPQHPTRADFYGRSASKSGFPAPDFKQELLNWKIINSVEVPRLLLYSFREKLT